MEKTKELMITRITSLARETIQDAVTVERVLNLYLNGRQYAALLCSPGEEQELATGFLFGQQIITAWNEIDAFSQKGEDIILVTVSKQAVERFSERTALTSGCGRGSLKLSQLEAARLPHVNGAIGYNSKFITDSMNRFNQESRLFKETGGVHGCALYAKEGMIICCEDIGRHNAMDKVIGTALRQGIALEDKLLLCTGRISVDMAVKAAIAGIPIIASHSAPTSYAVELCQALGITLLGFVRGNRMNVYSHDQRIDTE